MTTFRIMVLNLLVPLLIGASPGPAADPKELAAAVDASYGRFGTKFFGQPQVRVFRARDGSVLLVHQAKYGGDGDHSENRLMMFTFRQGKSQKLLDLNIDFVEFVEEAGALKLIRGKAVESLCDVCDGWDAAEPDDVFFIPITVDVASQTIRAELTYSEKTDLLSRLETRAAKDVAEQLMYGDKRYPSFASAVTRRVKDLLAEIPCGTDAVPWRGRCFRRTEWAVDEEGCPEGVVLIPRGQDQPRCTPCEHVVPQQPANYCAGLRAKKAVAALDRAYQKLLKKRLRREQKENLERAQRTWLEFRDAWCAFIASGAEGGSAQPMVAAGCRAQVTQPRIKELEWVLNCQEGDLACPAP